jgi:AcrR family transcriptional regulator
VTLRAHNISLADRPADDGKIGAGVANIFRMDSKTPGRAAASPFRTAQERLEERDVKRQAVLLAAVSMFNERGFQATSLDDVAASLGVTKPVIYHYLGNKDQVLFECVKIGLAQLREAADAARGMPGNGLSRLQIFLRRYAEINMGAFGRCIVRTGEEALTPESRTQFRALKREIDMALRHLIAEGVADRSVQSDDVRLTAFTLAGALNWTGRWYREDGPMEREDIATRMVDILCAGLMPSASGCDHG